MSAGGSIPVHWLNNSKTDCGACLNSWPVPRASAAKNVCESVDKIVD